MKKIERLKAGEEIKFSGILYTARDQAHKRLVEALKNGKKLPINLKEAFIYYCGPTKSRPGKAIGSCGPTTSARMDKFTPELLKHGLSAMIGKGARSQEVVKAIKRCRGVYFLTLAGCGALLSKYIRRISLAAYKDLGPEAIYRLEVKDFPLIVGVDSRGRSVYKKSKN
ncbi:MAG TPA: FumA C-terminus/TtdB family hydratase beta subunit [Candidatus Margulisiibacteriota bacterium]|nr:FumA C-terminus/TtdB family hydratase beta subunit [Candidatus Margulisiibacteriota bacterium]